MTMFKEILDPLYGHSSWDEILSSLVSSPLLQRLRHIRLSNIDSTSLPGISGSTRYEHALGTMHLASRTPLVSRGIDPDDRLVILAAALLHDSAIPPFGHLVEEAYNLSGLSYNHEQKWHDLISGEDDNLGGAYDMQMYMGRHPGLIQWCNKAFGNNRADQVCNNIVETIQGKGKYGGLISSEMDLDNLDNVVRIAYHMGLKSSGSLPRSIAERIIKVEKGSVIFENDVEPFILSWCELRSEVYTHLMQAPEDFTGKVMLLHALSSLLKTGALDGQDWNMVDFQLLNTLVDSKDQFASRTAKQWLCGEMWKLIGLWWMDGPVPELSSLPEIGRQVGTAKHPIYLYRIKDKRYRKIKVKFISGADTIVGRESDKWMLGVASSGRTDMSKSDRQRTIKNLQTFFSGALEPVGNRFSPKPYIPQPELLDL